MLIHLYKLTNRLTETEYVGITSTSVKGRFARHVCAARRGKDTRIAKAIRKFGPEAFTVETLRRVNSVKLALKLETKFIKKFDTLWPNGYNSVAVGGGTWGFKFSNKSREKISGSCKGRIPWNKGRKLTASEKEKIFTPEFRKKLSLRAKGKTPWNLGIPATLGHRRKLSGKRPWNRGKKLGPLSRSHRRKIAKKIREVRAVKFWSSGKL